MGPPPQAASSRSRRVARERPVTLAVDIGGTGIKAMLLDRRGRPRSPPVMAATPRPATPTAVLAAVARIAHALGGFDRASVGFPGVVERGVVRTAANLHPDWIGVRVGRRLHRVLRRPIRVANDADIQGLGVVQGRGVELVVTLGTGIGSALFLDGRLLPNLELGHHPFRDRRTYEDLLGDQQLKRIGRTRWQIRLRAAVATLLRTFNCRILYLGGGNARLLPRRFHPRVRVASNLAGLLGGIRLWDDRGGRHRRARSAR